MTKFLNISTDNTLGGSSASDVLVASQKAVKDYVDQHGGGGGSVSIDDLTITKNSDDEIQAVATVNKNTAVGAQNPVYDWVGTLAEYEAQNIEADHPEWLCYITDDNVAVGSIVSDRDIGEIVFSTVPVRSAGVHLADGSLLDGTGIYKNFYNYMVDVYNAGHTSIFCSEADWQTEVASRGVCGKYVLDTSNLTIRLPRLKNKLLSDNAVVGNSTTLGFTNGTNNAGLYFYNSSSKGDALSALITGYGTSVGTTVSGASYLSSDKTVGLTTDPTKSGIEVASSVDVYCYVVIANTNKTPIEVDIDEIATDLAGKVDKGHQVVEFQEPTSANNYTWYRKYADGWVEQGGEATITANGNTINLPVAMANTHYTVYSIVMQNTGAYNRCYSRSITGIGMASSGGNNTSSWMVCGMAA